MSNLHASLDEANKHTPKGFDNAPSNNTIPWKDENDLSTYTENFKLPRAINFVDGTAVAPTTVDGAIYVIIGSGVLDASWGLLSAFGDWVRFANGSAVAITPAIGTECFDDTAAAWKEYDGTVWAVAGGGAGSNLYTADGTLTGKRTITAATFDLDFLGTGIDGIYTKNLANSKSAGISCDAEFYLRDNAGSLKTFINPNGQDSYHLFGDFGFGLSNPTFNVHIQDTNSSSKGLKVGNSGGSSAIVINTGGDINLINGSSSTATSIRSDFDSYINNNSLDLGIGLNTGIAAKVHIKSNEATVGTTALLVENSFGTDLLKVKDDGKVMIGVGTPSSIFQIQPTTATTNFRVQTPSGLDSVRIYTSNATCEFTMLNAGAVKNYITSGGNSYFNGGNVGFGTSTAPNSTVTITPTGASTNFRVNAPDGSDCFRVYTSNTNGYATFLAAGVIKTVIDSAGVSHFNGGNVGFGLSTGITEQLTLEGRAHLKDQTAPSTPTGGGTIYVEAGALKYIGSSGTITTLGAA